MKDLVMIVLACLLIIAGCKKEEKPALATLQTLEITDIELVSASCKAKITDDGNSEITQRGICWATTSQPTTSDFSKANGIGIGEYLCEMTGLVPDTKYYVRAYATNSVGTAYGSAIDFTTKTITIPTLTVVAPTEYTQTQAKSGGNVTKDGGAAITARGVCWSTNTNPTISENKTVNGTGTGSFESNITGLIPNTTYYIKAYATNSKGTGYSDAVSFKTKDITLSIVTVAQVTEKTTSTAKSGGNVKDDGGTSVTARGVCWSLNTSPTINDNKTTNGNGLGSYTSLITGLQPNTLYYVKAYATNSKGTAYSDAVSFTTNAISKPTVTTSIPSSIAQTSAVGNGKIDDNGGGVITEKGFCWSTSSNPTLSDNYVTSNSVNAAFSANISGLSVWTSYYIRAYAKNSAGVGYGDALSFTTLSWCVDFSKTHTAGNVAPVTKTVSYQTTLSNLSGSYKCWIIQNLGASNPATNYDDATEASAGWYWQFNQKQGYKHTGSVRTPNTTWINDYSNTSDWTTAYDPCKLLLSSSWSIVSNSEWGNVINNGSWNSISIPYQSVLKIHLSGELDKSTGSLEGRGEYGSYWSLTTSGSSWARYLSVSNLITRPDALKTWAMPIRCIKSPYDE